MKISKENIKSILFITLSNLGDIILTTPVIEKLYEEFPTARIDVITGAPGQEIFQHHPAVDNVTVYDKRRSLKERIWDILDLRRKRYDLAVDLKNSLVPYLIGARVKVGLFKKIPGPGKKCVIRHKKEEHLSRLLSLGIEAFSDTRFFVPVTDEDRDLINGILDSDRDKKTVVINPGAKSHLKRWDAAKYAELADRLVSKTGCRVFLTGNEDDTEVIRRVMSQVKEPVTDLCGKTSVGALSELIRRADLFITNDSAPLHIASAVNTPTIAIFGPSDEQKYGPLADGSRVITPDVPCRPCGTALCAIGPDEGCISRVEVDEVFRAAEEMLSDLKDG